jgi:hypothetical protein
MRKANSAMYIRKAKAEKDCKSMTRKLKLLKARRTADNARVVEKMQMKCERHTAVAVSDATVHLRNDLQKTIRGMETLKHNLGKSEVKMHDI